MKKTVLIFIFSLLLFISLTPTDFSGTVSFDFSLSTIDIQYQSNDYSGDEQLDTLQLTTLGLSFLTDLTDNLKLGLRAGYSFKEFTKTLSFQQLPLSVSLENTSFNSMYFGILADYRLLYYKTVSLNLQADISYFKMFRIQNIIPCIP